MVILGGGAFSYERGTPVDYDLLKQIKNRSPAPGLPARNRRAPSCPMNPQPSALNHINGDRTVRARRSHLGMTLGRPRKRVALKRFDRSTRALLTETKVESGTSQSKSGTSVNFR